MRERPILFSGAMVRAILDGRKTQTRRVVDPQPVYGDVAGTFASWMFKKRRATGHWLYPNAKSIILAECPYGVPGDRLSLRETFFAYGRWETRYSAKKGRDEWHFVDMTIECDRAYQYAADDPDVPLTNYRGGVLPGWWKRPAIFMPRVASRITLEVTDVGVEWLQEITEADAIAEGIEQTPEGFSVDSGRHFHAASARLSYASLWDSLNDGRGYGWDGNPWVWRVEFWRIEA